MIDTEPSIDGATATALDVRVDDHGRIADYSLALGDTDVTVADVLRALNLSEDVAVDGRHIECPATIRAVDALASGSLLTVDSDEIARCQSAGDPTEPVVEVSVVAGLDAGRSIPLGAGLYRIGASSRATRGTGTGIDSQSQLVQVDHDNVGAAAAAAPAASCQPQPWHEHGASIEAVFDNDHVLAIGRPVAAEPGYGRAIHRPPRHISADQVPPITLAVEVPTVGEPAALSWATLLAPIPIALVMALYFRPIFALFAAMGPVMALGRWFESRRRYRRTLRDRDQAIAAQTEEFALAASLQAEAIARHRWQGHPHVAELWRRSRSRSARLWERRPGDADFLSIAVGVGPERVDAVLAGKDLDPAIEHLMGRPLTIRAVPHVIDLQENIGIGLHGTRAATLAVARSVLMQLVSLHGPADVRVAVLCAPDAVAEWDWIKWLPHADPSLSSTRSAEIAKHLADTRDLVAAGRQSSTTAAQPEQVHVIVVDCAAADVAAIHRAALDAARPVRFVVVAPTAIALPAVCSAMVDVQGGVAHIATPLTAASPPMVCPIGVTETTAASWARALTSIVDPEVTDLSVASGSGVSLIRLLRYHSVQDLGARWADRAPNAPVQAPIGVCDDGRFVINLTEDGPHALIAGTTGSGKSELLRTLIIGLAIETPPESLNFVLIDFKGGGAFDAVDRLPHVAGLITDLDESLVERAITSLRAELQRREVLFRRLGVSDFEQAIERSVEPLARLVIVIDEFATLATDYSELMTAVIDLAARGRSLGMHLVLATQRPSGVVDQKIRANTNLRVALRVQDAFDSQDVVGTGAAAAIDRKTPGRAIFCAGGDAPIAVQTAFSGAVDTRAQRCEVRSLSLFRDDGDLSTARGETELDVLVSAIAAVSAQRDVFARSLWAEPLPESLDWIDLAARELSGRPDHSPAVSPIGLEDVPELQSQRPWRWDPDSGPLAIYGASAACSANVLVSVGAALSGQPESPHLYVIDGDAGGAQRLEVLENTGAYVTVDDLDRIERVIRFFESALASRRGDQRMTQAQPLVLMIDNLASTLAAFDENQAADLVDRLAALARDGSPRRIHVVIAARTVRDIGHRLGQQFPNRLVLALADMTSYLTLGLAARDVPVLPAMRAIDMATGRRVQIVEPPPDLTSWQAPRPLRVEPKPIGSFPSSFGRDRLGSASYRDGVLALPLAIGAEDLAPIELVLRPDEHGLVVAANGLGRSNATRLILQQVDSVQPDVELIRVGPRSSPIRDAELPGRVTDSADDIAELMSSSRDASEVVVVVDDADRLEPAMTTALGDLVSQRRPGIRVLAATTPVHARNVRSWLAPVRADGVGVLLSGAPLDGDLFAVRVARLAAAGHLPGRGYIIHHGQVAPAQIALAT